MQAIIAPAPKVSASASRYITRVSSQSELFGTRPVSGVQDRIAVPVAAPKPSTSRSR